MPSARLTVGDLPERYQLEAYRQLGKVMVSQSGRVVASLPPGSKIGPQPIAEVPREDKIARKGLKTPDLAFCSLCQKEAILAPLAEYRFHPTRKWRFDYAWPKNLLALEVEGGIWTQGRHTRGVGFMKDLEKYGEAAALGWRILRVTPTQLATSKTMDLIRRALAFVPGCNTALTG